MNLFRTVFGNRAEEFEDKGDDLKLHGFCREAAYFYGRALESLPEKDERNRRRVSEKSTLVRRGAFRRLLDDAESLAESGRNAEALSLLREAEPFAGDSDDRAILMARLSVWSGESQEPAAGAAVPADAGEAGAPATTPIQRLEREVLLRPESSSAHERLARALEKEGRFGDAVRYYEAAYQRNREKTSLVLEIVRVLKSSLNDATAAGARLEEACRRHRPSAAAFLLHLERAFHLADEGRDEEAIAALGGLLQTPGLDHGLVLFNRAGLLARVGRPGEAEADLLKALESEPSHVLYLERLADLIFQTTDDLDRALECLDKALSALAHDFALRGRVSGTSPDRARLQFKAARILFLLDRPSEARLRVDDGLVVCWDPRVEEALLDLRRELEP